MRDDFCERHNIWTAEKLVAQAESQLAVHPQSAYAIATVAAALCSHFKLLTNVFLAQLHAQCPFTIPMYPPPVKVTVTVCSLF